MLPKGKDLSYSLVASFSLCFFTYIHWHTHLIALSFQFSAFIRWQASRTHKPFLFYWAFSSPHSSFPSLPSFPRNDTVRFWNISFPVGTGFAFPPPSICFSSARTTQMDGMREPRPSWVACMLREVAGDSSSLQTAWDVMHVDSVKPALLESRKETRAERKALASVKRNGSHALGLWHCPERQRWIHARSPLMHLTRIGKAGISKQADVLLSATLNEREIEVWDQWLPHYLISGERGGLSH